MCSVTLFWLLFYCTSLDVVILLCCYLAPKPFTIRKGDPSKAAEIAANREVVVFVMRLWILLHWTNTFFVFWQPQLVTSRHDPKAVGALVMPRPSHAHQAINHNGIMHQLYYIHCSYWWINYLVGVQQKRFAPCWRGRWSSFVKSTEISSTWWNCLSLWVYNEYEAFLGTRSHSSVKKLVEPNWSRILS